MGKPSYLGVDLGTSSVKVVELVNFKGRPRLLTYGFTEKKIIDPNRESKTVTDTTKAAAILNEICRKSHTSSRKVVAALPNFSVFTSILNLPALSKKELTSAITWEAKKIIPIPLEEIILDWKIITEDDEEGNNPTDGNLQIMSDKTMSPKVPQDLNEQKLSAGQIDKASVPFHNSSAVSQSQEIGSFKKIFSKPKKNIKILLTGASKKLVKTYVDIFNKAGLTLLSLETESFALTRSLIGNDKSIIMLVDLGATTSSITVIDRGVPVVSRSIEVGGSMITGAISNSLNVNMERAEQFKQDMSLGNESAENSLPQIVEKSFAMILNEIKYTVSLFQEQHGNKIEKIILTGGSSSLGNLSGYLAKILNINTYIGDPWARVVYPTELKPVLDRIGPRFAVSVGLAMRDIE